MLELDAIDTAAVSVRRAARYRTALLLGVVGAVVGFAGSWIPSYWGDEAASVMSASRTWPSLFAVLGNVDGVHGLYYGLLHVWVHVFGTSEAATRAPSAIAVGFMVAGTVVLTRAFVGTRVAVGAASPTRVSASSRSMKVSTSSIAAW